MILVGSQRAGAKALAQHLLKEENDHVEVHELRGFASDNLTGALGEAYAISRGTRCKQYLFSLSLNPPPGENVPTSAFEDAITRAEDKLGLTDQPRAIVFHEKEGRRHCHVVWSRIDADQMKAVHLPFTHQKLQELSRDLYIEYGWTMPRGLMKSEERDPRNFTLAEWQQGLRTGRDAREIKTALQDCWAVSDSKQSLSAALEQRGFKLARGDRRSVVAVDAEGEVYALARWVGAKTKDVRARVGDESALPSIAEGQAALAGQVGERLQALKAQQRGEQARRLSGMREARGSLVREQREVRQGLSETHAARWEQETHERQARFRAGLRGLWDLLTGRHRRIKEQNEAETLCALRRDRAEKDALIFAQVEARRSLQQRLLGFREESTTQRRALEADIDRYESVRSEARRAMLEDLRKRRMPRGERDTDPADGSSDERLERLRELRAQRQVQPTDHGPQPEQ